MDITPKLSEKIALLQGYGEQGFKVNETFYPHSIWLQKAAVTPASIKSMADITEQWFSQILAHTPAPQLLILGTGEQQQFLPAALNVWLKSKGVLVECMNTGAACRTYNVLAAEERNVAALLIHGTGA